MRRWRGLKSLVHDAVDQVTDLVREGHESVARNVVRVTDVAEPIAAPARQVDAVRRATTDAVLATVRGVNRGVEAITDAGLDLAEAAARTRGIALGDESPVPLRSDAAGSATWVADAALALVNAAVGDHLHARDNGLDLGMRVRRGTRYVDFDVAADLEGLGPRVALFVHGLGTTEWCWTLESQAYHGDPEASFATLLEHDLGHHGLLLRYNTGRRVSENGRALATLLERLVTAASIEEVVLVGHSMGGLVIRSACRYATDEGMTWPSIVKHVFCLGSPHQGAPLAQLGHVAAAVLYAIDTPATRITARVLRGRSAGIKDLRGGSLVDDDWVGRDPDALGGPPPAAVALLPGVQYHFVSATVTRDASHPFGRVVGDLLVRTGSAAGPRIPNDLAHATFPIDTAHYGGVMHHQIQNHPAVYAQLRAALER